jgi:hypothetical protein
MTWTWVVFLYSPLLGVLFNEIYHGLIIIYLIEIDLM